jgi:hypothetical protein
LPIKTKTRIHILKIQRTILRLLTYKTTKLGMPFFIKYSFVIHKKKPAHAGNIAGWFFIKELWLENK